MSTVHEPSVERVVSLIKTTHFSGQVAWLNRNAPAEACRMFDEHGWRRGWVSIDELARSMYPHHSATAAANYVRSLISYLVAEGEQTGFPQLLKGVGSKRGQVSFEVQR